MSSLILPLVGVLVGVSILEGIVWSLRRRDYDWRAFGVSMFDLAVTIGLRIVIPLGIAAPVFALAEEHRLYAIELDQLWQFFLLFLGQEYCYYWFHRASHRIRWFWASHAVHHSPQSRSASPPPSGWASPAACPARRCSIRRSSCLASTARS